jgi:adenylate kinase family enzyme
MLFCDDDFSTRLLILGNSGSGKSVLAERTATFTTQRIFDLDLIHWHADGNKREEDVSRTIVSSIANDDGWIIEGVYGWLIERAVPRATAMIWLDMPWEICRESLVRRGMRRNMTEADQQALFAWAEAYWTRTTSSSAQGHRHLFEMFKKTKIRITSRAELDAL